MTQLSSRILLSPFFFRGISKHFLSDTCSFSLILRTSLLGTSVARSRGLLGAFITVPSPCPSDNSRSRSSDHGKSPLPTICTSPRLISVKGAWGYNFFESDQDHDAISDINVDAKLESIKSAHIAEIARLKSPPDFILEELEAEKLSPDDPSPELIGLSINNPLFPRLVRDHLEDKVLFDMIDDLRKCRDYYSLCLLTACAMKLGCDLPRGFRAYLRRVCFKAELLPGALQQLKLALTEYEEGVPYDIERKGLDSDSEHDTIKSTTVYPALEIDHEEKREDVTTEQIPFDFNHPVNSCGNCGRDHDSAGRPLMRCEGCKNRLYCSRSCQMSHWRFHHCVR